MSGKISVKAETIAHVVKELESISQKYDEIAQNFGKIAQLNYYSSEKAAHSMENGYSSAARSQRSIEYTRWWRHEFSTKVL
ncbi:Uncharacterised protein [Staphylococcus aureus]|nr:Uncharacterised protein [Staphylococcus aureus]